jgi:hypothetical protein
MFRFNYHHQGAYYLSLAKVTVVKIIIIQIKLLNNYFNNSNFNRAQIIRSLMMVIKPKHVGAV